MTGLDNLRRQLLTACLRMLDSGLITGTWGMACVRVPQTSYALITPSGMDYRTLEPSDVPLIDLQGNVIEGDRRPSTETPMMMRLLKKRPDIGAVAHTHSTIATGFAAARRPIPAVLAELAEAIGGEVPCARYARFGTPELADCILEVAADRCAVLLANHGLVAFGSTVDEAVDAALVVEEAARVALAAQLLGGGHVLPDNEIAALRRIHVAHYGQGAS